MEPENTAGAPQQTVPPPQTFGESPWTGHDSSLAGVPHVRQTAGTPFAPNERHEIAMALRRKLGPDNIAHRSGPGGTRIPYLEGFRALNLINEVFGFDGWSSQVMRTSLDFCDTGSDGRLSLGVSAVVRVSLRDGTFHEDVGFGTLAGARNKAEAFQKALKEAVTDALKRAIRQFGNVLGNCLYDKEHLRHISRMRAPQVPPPGASELYNSAAHAPGSRGGPLPANATAARPAPAPAAAPPPARPPAQAARPVTAPNPQPQPLPAAHAVECHDMDHLDDSLDAALAESLDPDILILQDDDYVAEIEVPAAAASAASANGNSRKRPASGPSPVKPAAPGAPARGAPARVAPANVMPVWPAVAAPRSTGQFQ